VRGLRLLLLLKDVLPAVLLLLPLLVEDWPWMGLSRLRCTMTLSSNTAAGSSSRAPGGVPRSAKANTSPSTTG
jgi:hypothetical protein